MTRSSTISTAEAAEWLASPDAPTVIDVRTPAEFAGSRIEGAVNVPLDLVEKQAAQIGEQLDGEVLLVCRTDRRASEAARLLGPTIGGRGHVLSCGMAQWEQDGHAVEQGEGGPWAMERQVRAAAGTLVLTGILASTVVPQAKWLAGGVGAGLLWSGLSDTCAMATVLGTLPWNRRAEQPTVASVTRELKES
ncbi:MULTISPECIES: rhodanese-like domain-containing protein [Arsenicicoccus]|uniref:rhodanese-like domain-containing protein n=1 Tax=Arsenicicoccus TaxID=267408 RepID=UPI00257E5FF3|nr:MULTISPECIES: rhodanese-like domain-containing protein [Arsenicicoccus]